MGFTSYEFPNVDVYDSDLRELLGLYKKLKAEYDNLQNEINSVISYIENFKTTTDKIVQDAIDSALDIWRNRVSVLEVKVAAIEKELTKSNFDIERLKLRIEEVRTELKFEMMQYENSLNAVYEELAKYKKSIDGIIQEKVTYLEIYIKEHVTKLDRLDVVNPIDKSYEDINIVLDEMYKIMQQSFSIKAGEYDNMHMTARIYDGLKITAIQYDTRGWLLLFRGMQLTTRSPWSGWWITYKEYLDRLVAYHKCGLTASEYDSLKLTAKEFDDYVMSAYKYDWCGKCILTARGITAGEYDSMQIKAGIYDQLLIKAGWYDKKGKKLMMLNAKKGGCCNETDCKHGFINL